MYNLTVVNADCSVVIYPNAIQVVAATASAVNPAPGSPTNLAATTKTTARAQKGSASAASGNAPSSASKTKTTSSSTPET
jgi:acetaldehyde dehydrogenase (acetylating)